MNATAVCSGQMFLTATGGMGLQRFYRCASSHKILPGDLLMKACPSCERAVSFTDLGTLESRTVHEVRFPMGEHYHRWEQFKPQEHKDGNQSDLGQLAERILQEHSEDA